jgi:MFS family permease
MAPQQQISFKAWKTILVLCGSVIIFLYLNTSMSPALPSIENQFDVSSEVASWVLTAYMVCGAVMTVIMGRLADLFGAKRMQMIMMICFTVGTILAPFAPNFSILIALRVLQGIAVATTPISTKLIRDNVPASKFPVAMSIYLACYMGGMAIGAVMGPPVAANLGWQGNFYLIAPIAVVILFASWKFIHVDESKKIEEHDRIDRERPSDIPKKAKRQDKHIDFIGIAILTVTLVSFLVAITYSTSITTNLARFAVPLAIGVISMVILFIVEKRLKDPLVNLKLIFHPLIFSGNIMMLMFGILEYFIITGTPTLGSAPPPSGLGLDPLHTGLLQLSFGLAGMIFGPIFGLIVANGIAKGKPTNLKFLVPGIGIVTITYLLLLFFHYSSAGINLGLFVFGIASGLAPNTIIVTTTSFTPREYTGMGSSITNMMRIVGASIGPVLVTVILAIATIPITVDNVEKNYPDPITYNILYGVGLAMSIACVFLAIRMRRLATKTKPLTADEMRE